MANVNPMDAPTVDPLIQRMRDARNSPNILKLELARRRSTEAALPFLVLEGDDDKIVYAQWISRLRPSLKYALFPCRGKGHLLSLLDLVRRDATGLAEGVYFFVDRDFDDLRNREAGSDVYMTDSYAFENYVVSECVLEKLLQIEFHCHSCAETRSSILNIFREDYKKFLEETKAVNLRLYKARKMGLPTDSITNTLAKLASVSVGNVRSGTASPEEIIKFQDSIDDELSADLEKDFSELDASKRYRGKFALAFFKKWLRDLGETHRPGEGLFEKIDTRSAFRLEEITLNSMASKSEMPDGLLEYIASIEGAVET
ncbi:DUF4435 domain-containing protein [Brevundimonas diminuta]|uniref:DUF4435 domain-containing protein n=1 Tax=Brevundimonas diminuta TaxID=293 RepID=UPI002097A9B7|nr:DUF4435 domain-containing protein [Brevundimonas diminuta]MCO8018697.1 DUF4435 domain-containing protein [Brevundimonas diminuta]MCO8020451.1 DUF4435 domain-containing protein [Brevundimonas diminuta]